ncbi:MAG TPA: helix-turn-helix transcriptional regulator [Intrasporangium sp.]|uniref:helix-turn-helix domain-containing protein n=1 Tax=Intrasporangium sp. TaxID=1925024 RepID=UPI002B47E1F8|nr:helix-turn-helix transcriptional regulator [Intrasporangium sp.]HKX65866.1 helix-turn-helix transcriptional regulator [Intrasporangium sp.]
MRTKRGHLDEDDFNQALAAEVRALLARHRKVQADVARQLGMKPNAASFRWQGKTPWSLAELLLLCDWLDVDAAEVISAAKAAAVARTPQTPAVSN